MKNTSFFLTLILLFISALTEAFCQNIMPVKEAAIHVDSLYFTLQKNVINIDGITYLYFFVEDAQPTLVLDFTTDSTVKNLKITEAADFEILEPLKELSPYKFRGKIKLNDIVKFNKTALNINIQTTSNILAPFLLHLFPIARPGFNNDSFVKSIYQGEQKIIEIPVENGFNIKQEPAFILGKDFDYKYTVILNFLELTIKPHFTGSKMITIPFSTQIPIIDNANKISNYLKPLTINVNVKAFRLSYTNFDRNTLYINADGKNKEQVMMDFNPFLELNQKYKIEDEEGNSGNLIAELYIQSYLENSKKLLCTIKPFALHKMTDGYLFIKEGDKNRFICNINIVEKPQIAKLYIRREGADWVEDLSVFPNESIEVKVIGKGLQGNTIQFEGLGPAKPDSSTSTEESQYFKLKVPVSISQKHIAVFLNKKETRHQLIVKDYQLPAPLGFISVNFGQSELNLTNAKLNKPVFIDNIIKDVNFTFDAGKIDQGNKLYGKQYISIEVKLLNKDNDLIEIEKIENVCIAPSDDSPRKAFYDVSDCTNERTLSINDYLDHKTYNLPAFTQILITISHNDAKYERKGFTKKIKLILERKYNVDLQLSFPTGLLVKRLNESGVGSLSGISASVLLNLSRYDNKEFGRLKPYTIGVGFLALNALNLSNSQSSDIGLVSMATIHPIRKSAKFSVPIYLGGGYFVKRNFWFLIFGPGLQFNF